jgi:glutathione S-transferase
MIARIEWRLNDVSEDAVRDDLAALPGHLDRVDGWIADGVIGGEAPNAADLQIAPTIRLMMVVGDARAMIDGRPSAELALRLFPQWDGDIPVGVLPEPALAAAAAAAS